MANLNSTEEEKKIILPVIHDDIILCNILTRVPEENKSLLRFRCVCKNWAKLFFHNPLFINILRQKYKGHSCSSSGLITTNEDRSLVFINHSDKKQRVNPMTNITIRYRVKILQSLNGFLLVRCQNLPDEYYVYNPITNCSVMILGASNNFDLHRIHYYLRLCYDPIREQYKVVFCGYSALHNPQSYRIKILTLQHGLGGASCVGNRSWRDIIVPEHFTVNYYESVESVGIYGHRCRCFCVNGSLYWIIENSSVKNKPYILSLDTCKESFYKIELPSEVSRSEYGRKHLNEMEGLLCLSKGFEINEFKIWTLKQKHVHEDGDMDEWLWRRFQINLDRCMGKEVYLLGIHEFWPLAIFTVPKVKFIIVRKEVSSYTYFSYDLESKQLKIIHGPTSWHVHWHVNSIANCYCSDTK